MSRRLLAVAIGLVAAALGGGVAWAIVGRALREWESGAFVATTETLIVVLAAVVLGVIAAVVAWRRLLGPPIEHGEWTLTLPGAAPGAPVPPLGDLLAPLERLGYQLDVHRVDDLGVRGEALPRGRPFAGRPVEVSLRGVDPRHGRIILRVPSPRGGEVALGFVDSYGVLDGAYEELGQYLIASLGLLFPGCTFRRLSSGLTEEPCSALWDHLPPTPTRPHPS